MRAVFFATATFAALISAYTAGATPGAYSSGPAADAIACARICADDGLCVAWSYQADGACELRATAPANPTGAAFGVSDRAPAALRRETPGERGESKVSDEPAAAPVIAESEAPPRRNGDVDQLLLGGLEEDASGLRN